jgi:5-methylcytosine-specific restriction endonuclease McrA
MEAKELKTDVFSHNRLWSSIVIPAIKQKYNNQCYYCKGSVNLQVHHLSYEDQVIDNLVLLCKDCHQNIHLIKDIDEPCEEDIIKSLNEVLTKEAQDKLMKEILG